MSALEKWVHAVELRAGYDVAAPARAELDALQSAASSRFAEALRWIGRNCWRNERLCWEINDIQIEVGAPEELRPALRLLGDAQGRREERSNGT